MVYESRYYLLVADLVEQPDGRRYRYERLIAREPGNAVVIILRAQGKLVLLRPFRHASRELEYSFPRGFGEPGISPSANAVKELGEELGARPSSLRLLGQVIANSGITGDRASVFFSRDPASPAPSGL